jgi:predicted amidohydrolase
MEWEDKAATKARISALLEKSLTAVADCDWLVFPEMTLSGYSMHPAKATLDEGDLEFFRALARDRSLAVTFGGVVDNRNCCITFGKRGEPLSHYAKAHLFSYAGEDKIYSAGGEAEPFQLSGNGVVPSVCYDLRFPYHFWKHAREARFLVVIASWPASRALHWASLLRARAIENQAFVIGVNRSGRDPRLEYAGGSVVYGPAGEDLLTAPPEEGLYAIEVDPGRVEAVRASFPFLLDRRHRF